MKKNGMIFLLCAVLLFADCSSDSSSSGSSSSSGASGTLVNYDFEDGDFDVVEKTGTEWKTAHWLNVSTTELESGTVTFMYVGKKRQYSDLYFSLYSQSAGAVISEGPFDSSKRYAYTSAYDSGKYTVQLTGKYNSQIYSYTVYMVIGD